MIHALKDFNISVLSNQWNPNKVYSHFKVKIPNIKWIQCQPFTPKFSHLEAFQWIKYSNTINETIQRLSKDYDIMIETQQVYVSPPPPIKLINYMHYPYLLIPPPEANRAVIRFYYTVLRRMLSKRVKRINSILTNSPFTAEIIKNHLGVEPTVVYPPVEVDRFYSDNDWGDREDKVINVGSFVPFKRQLTLLEVAEYFPNIKFVLIGLLDKRHKEHYKKIIRNKTENVTVMHDVSHETLKKELSTSKAYIHLCPEHFGISVIEAVAAGCAPIVYHVGGPADILGKTAIQWSNIEEAKKAVQDIIGWKSNEELWTELVKGTRAKISSFTASIFEHKIRELIK